MSIKKGKIGYTTGVFDMFHVGHLNILRQAKENCDYLIVGVSSDALVESYKSKKPVIPFNHRKEIIESIKFVDKVIVQSHRDKMKSFHEIGFDIMFVGSDWKGSELFNVLEKEFKKYARRKATSLKDIKIIDNWARLKTSNMCVR